MTISGRVYLGAGMAAMMLVGCARTGSTEPPSAIVRKLQDAGAGDLSTASAASIQQWLGPRRALADEVEALCKPIRATAKVSWAETAEGRVCVAAHTLSFFRFQPM